MAIYSAQVLSNNNAISTPQIEVVAGSHGYRLLEFGGTQLTSVVSTIGLGPPAAVGITPSGSFARPDDGGNTSASTTRGAASWGTLPTSPVQFLRRISLVSTIGSGFVWTFPRGVQILSAKTLVLWNITASATFQCWFVVDE